MNSIYTLFDKLFDLAQTFGPQEWAIISGVTLVLGYMCLRGMNIR